MKIKQQREKRLICMAKSEWLRIGRRQGWDTDQPLRRSAKAEKPVEMLVKQHGERTYLIYLDGEFVCAMAHPEGAEKNFGKFDELLRQVQDGRWNVRLVS